MAVIRNQADTILQATSPRLLLNPLNYISIIPSTNTITNVSGSLLPTTISVKAILNGSLKGTISWSTSPSVVFTSITDGIVFNSSVVAEGTAVIVTATLTFNGNTYTATTTITRKQSVSLSSGGVLTGENGGSITNLDYTNVGGTKPPANATANFFTTSTLDPTGGIDGAAHYNSNTNVMWFKVNGVWQKGGTVNASQITVGTLAAARIAAGSIDATKLSVSSLSAITANLGTVNAGDITGTANIDIAGTAKFAGSTNSGGVLYCGVFNDGETIAGGLLAKGVNSGGFGVHGKITSGSLLSVGVKGENTGGRGVEGFATTGVGVYATATTGQALSVVGTMGITSTTLVSNLNADMVDGLHASSFAKISGGNTFVGDQTFGNNITVTGQVRAGAFRLDQPAVTGTATATFPGNNKPGSTTTCKFIPHTVDGVFGHIAWWPNV